MKFLSRFSSRALSAAASVVVAVLTFSCAMQDDGAIVSHHRTRVDTNAVYNVLTVTTDPVFTNTAEFEACFRYLYGRPQVVMLAPGRFDLYFGYVAINELPPGHVSAKAFTEPPYKLRTLTIVQARETASLPTGNNTFPPPSPSDTFVCTPPDVTLTNYADAGPLLVVANKGTMPVQIETLQIALSDQLVPADNCDYADPLIQALPWTTVGVANVQIIPGQSFSFAISSYFLPPYFKHQYLRCHYSDVAAGSPTNDYVVAVGALPILHIAPTNHSITLTWPAGFSNFIPQTANSINAAWTPLTNPPALIGTNLVITESFDAAAKFYRLQSP